MFGRQYVNRPSMYGVQGYVRLTSITIFTNRKRPSWIRFWKWSQGGVVIIVNVTEISLLIFKSRLRLNFLFKLLFYFKRYVTRKYRHAALHVLRQSVCTEPTHWASPNFIRTLCNARSTQVFNFQLPAVNDNNSVEEQTLQVGPLSSRVVTICTTCCNILKHGILATECIYVFRMLRMVQKDCLPTQPYTADLCSEEVMLFLWGTNWILIYYLEEIQALKG
jgi:hypothetical protein